VHYTGGHRTEANNNRRKRKEKSVEENKSHNHSRDIRGREVSGRN